MSNTFAMKGHKSISARAVHAIGKFCRFDNRRVATSTLAPNSGYAQRGGGGGAQLVNVVAYLPGICNFCTKSRLASIVPDRLLLVSGIYVRQYEQKELCVRFAADTPEHTDRTLT